ncbi:hypothetical protein DICPUDRAFT_157508 [Dictyostelium purpureum]|uniref:Uncharacterized protein n=1 Tax=Dictyostelium purpureum TaxID=5786 RepID=F0ZZA8_DICPU|nr:uncharacterized protein DICPUDRAFT_157508 [Dictyostelium purpureum]EGC30722.1 hypothetical protein DICPUDRAFT_157508 [Dictyostelium purpureum]|eukprot:XP_003292757.1 hypothetical protein DICPUDRAFT_157508 [Dictyostelium purpureum]
MAETSFEDAWFSNCKSGYLDDIIQLVSSKKISIDSSDHLGNTGLHYASNAGHTAVVEAIIKAGANINAQNKHGDTPLHKAAGRNRLDTVKFLVKNKANIDIVNVDKERAIDITNNQEIKNELLPVVEFEDDDSEEDKKDDSDYDSEEEGDD